MSAPVQPVAPAEELAELLEERSDFHMPTMADATLADGSAAPTKGFKGITGGASAFPLAVLFGLALFETMDRASVKILLPDIRDAFGLSNSGILAILALGSMSGLLLTIPVAVMADRSSRVRLMLVGATIFSFFSIMTGTIPVNWLLLLLARSGAGIGQATVFPTHNSLMADYYDIPFRPKVYSTHRAAEAIGLASGYLLAGFLGQTFGWRIPFILIAIPCLVLVVVGMRLKEPVRGFWERKAMGVTGDAVVLEEPPPSFEEAYRMANSINSLKRVFWATPFLAVAFVGFDSLANLLYEQEFHLEPFARGVIESIAELGGLIGLVGSAVFGTKLAAKDPALLIRFIAVVTTLAAIMSAGFALAPTVFIGVLFRIGIAASLAAVLPSVFAVLSLAVPARSRAAGFSITALYVVPGLLILPLIGYATDHLGIRTGMLFMCPVLLIGGIIASSAHKTIDQDIHEVWVATAARSELMDQRNKGNIKQLLVRGLDVKYGDVQVLFGVDFEIGEGEIVALLGTNGAGKSTLLKAITGTIEASSGVVVFDGRDITHAPPNEIASQGIAMVPGGQGVFPSLTVAENLRVAAWIERKRDRQGEGGSVAAKMAEVIEIFPILTARMDDPAANLSGGQQQMLALAMAFLSEPKLLVIDELSLGLAPVIVEQLVGIVRQIRDQGTTIILVEQSVNVALTLAETAYFMEKGEIRFKGPTSELLDRPDVLRSVFLEGAQKGMAAAGENGSTAPPIGSNGANGTNGTAIPAATEAVPERFTSDAPAGLAVQGLSVRFGGIRAVDDVTFSVAPGEIVGIIGPNGAGKTTMFDLISGFTKADAGVVWMGGNQLSGKTPDFRARAGLGRSFQDARLFPSLTVEETLTVALERWVEVRDPFNAMLRLPAQQDSEWALRERVDELIELMGIESFRSKFVRELSTGSRRVVDLACVLAHHPSVVLLDEPSSGIAQREAEALGPLIVRIRDTLDACILVIEHDMPLVTSVSNRLIALDQGHVITIGTPDEVLNHPEVVASYLGNSEEVINRSGSRTEN